VGEKAFLYACGKEIVIGHSIERLCRAASCHESKFSEYSRRWSILDGYYVPTRYSNSLPDSIPAKVYTQDAAKEAVQLAEEIVLTVSKRISEIESSPGGS
jgi:HEPN domain-containing protein